MEPFAQVFFHSFENMKEQLATMIELPGEIRNEVSLYAQISHRERIGEVCRKSAEFYDGLKVLDITVGKMGLRSVIKPVQKLFIKLFIQKMTYLLDNLGQKQKVGV